ncbi:hypothetical protein DY926_15490 [Komagataeibacter melaceti]|uniref:Uncharacterized protein n=1 Tax=Komagataeibacter melaceti TaxID=2766577 RepID=A0A371YWP7_9PROT|nr:hypothetical protein DY926_15490 [Komagataeibacter melaceti]
MFVILWKGRNPAGQCRVPVFLFFTPLPRPGRGDGRKGGASRRDRGDPQACAAKQSGRGHEPTNPLRLARRSGASFFLVFPFLLFSASRSHAAG